MPIDTHAHYVPPRLIEALEADANDCGVSIARAPPACQCALHFETGLKLRPCPAKLIEPAPDRIAAMDRIGIDRQVLSAWADIFGYGLPMAKALKWHRRLNLAMAELAAAHPTRFSFIASVPLPYAAEAAEELRFAIRELGAVGAVVGANVEDVNLGEVPLDTFWSACVELDAGVLIHPAVPSQGTGRAAKFGLAQVAQYTYDTTLCVGSLIATGVLDRFPGLRLLLCHGGGTYPYLAGRFDIMHARTDRAAMGNVARATPSTYLDRFYYDTILHSPNTLQFLASQVGVKNIVIGSDYSFPPADENPLETLRQAAFSKAEIAMISETNPRLLFAQLPALTS